MLGTGAMLNDRYQLGREIGNGGFARVFLATDLTLQRRVAIKLLHDDYARDPAFLAHFLAEARRAAGLAHPHILPVYDFGQLADTAFLVMPFVPGGTLHDRLLQAGRLSLAEASDSIRQAAAALDYAHARRLVHRDVKPQNMLRDEAGRLLLADFGIAKLLHEEGAAESSPTVGTVAYMAPESFNNVVSPAVDIYALGCILFELLTGQSPYAGTTHQVMLKHANSPIPSLAAYLPATPALPAMQRVVEIALAKDPAARYASAGELAAAVEAIAQGRFFLTPNPAAIAPMASPSLRQEHLTTTRLRVAPVAVPAPAPSPPPISIPPIPRPATPGTAGNNARPRQRRPVLALGGGILALALASALIFGIVATGRIAGQNTPSATSASGIATTQSVGEVATSTITTGVTAAPANANGPTSTVTPTAAAAASAPPAASTASRSAMPAAAGATTRPASPPTAVIAHAATARSVQPNRQPGPATDNFKNGEEIYITFDIAAAQGGSTVDIAITRDGAPVALTGNRLAIEAGNGDATFASYKFVPHAKGTYRVDLFLNSTAASAQTLSFTVR